MNMEPIRVATVFSGIGAAEQALKQLGVEHEINNLVDQIKDRYNKYKERSMDMIFNHDDTRNAYKKDDYVDEVTINAVIDNDEIGDERYNFVTVRKQGENEFKKVIKAYPGDKFTVRVFFHNNADPSLNDKGISRDTKIAFTDGVFCSSEEKWKEYGPDSVGFMGYIFSSNSKPESVRDFCVVEKATYCFCEYIKDSARIINDSGTHRLAFPKYPYGEIIGVGETMDGIIPAGASGYIELDFETSKAD